MGLCCQKMCTKHIDDAGVCAVCLYDCTSKVCDCSYIHKECMKGYLKHNGTTCGICAKAFRTINLQKAPLVSKKEEEFLRKKTELHFRIEFYLLRNWANAIFPRIVGFFAYKGWTPCDLEISMQTICDGAENENSFIQYLMNKGMKRKVVDRHLDIMSDTLETYEILHKKNRSMLEKHFRRCNYTFSWSDSDDL